MCQVSSVMAARRQDYLHLTEVVQIDSVVGRAKGQEIGGHWAELHAADVGLGIYHRCWRLLPDAPQAHCAVIATRDKSRGVCLHARRDCFSAHRHHVPYHTGVLVISSLVCEA